MHTHPTPPRHSHPLFARAAGDDSAASSGEGAGDAPLQEQAGAFAYSHIAPNLERMDANQLQTALATAIAAEDYALAAAIRDRVDAVMGGGGRSLDWTALGVNEWVADRAERLGLRFPTGEWRQRRLGGGRGVRQQGPSSWVPAAAAADLAAARAAVASRRRCLTSCAHAAAPLLAAPAAPQRSSAAPRPCCCPALTR